MDEKQVMVRYVQRGRIGLCTEREVMNAVGKHEVPEGQVKTDEGPVHVGDRLMNGNSPKTEGIKSGCQGLCGD